MAARVVENVLELAEDTPLVRLHMGGPAEVWAKCEHLLPSGSLKDRVADGELGRSKVPRGGSVVVASSGSSAAALAIAGKLRGVKIVAAMPRTMALEKRSLLRGLGVELVLTDGELGMAGAREKAAAIAAERGIPLVAMDHADGARVTGEEILSALGGVPDVLVVGVGTGATLRALASVVRSPRIVAVRAAIPTTRTAGLSDAAIDVGEMHTVEDADAWQTARRLAREEGLLVGPSSGACVRVACEIAATLPPSARVCTLLGDTGERYFSIGQFFA